MDQDEPLDHAAARELQEETSVDPSSVLLEQVQYVCVKYLRRRVLCFVQVDCGAVYSLARSVL